MADTYREGQTATGPKGEQYIWQGGAWRMQAQNARDAESRKQLGELRTQADSAGEVQRLYGNVGQALKDFQPSPLKGRLYDVATAQDGGGILDTLGATVIGAPLRALGAITPKQDRAFQLLKAQQAERVAARQVEQKGVQTESDAARYALADISPYKDTAVNQQIVDLGNRKLSRVQGRAQFYTAWANAHGLNGVDGQGRGVEQAFQDSVGAAPAQNQAAPSGWSIKRK